MGCSGSVESSNHGNSVGRFNEEAQDSGTCTTARTEDTPHNDEATPLRLRTRSSDEMLSGQGSGHNETPLSDTTTFLVENPLSLHRPTPLALFQPPTLVTHCSQTGSMNSYPDQVPSLPTPDYSIGGSLAGENSGSSAVPHNPLALVRPADSAGCIQQHADGTTLRLTQQPELSRNTFSVRTDSSGWGRSLGDGGSTLGKQETAEGELMSQPDPLFWMDFIDPEPLATTGEEPETPSVQSPPLNPAVAQWMQNVS